MWMDLHFHFMYSTANVTFNIVYILLSFSPSIRSFFLPSYFGIYVCRMSFFSFCFP